MRHTTLNLNGTLYELHLDLRTRLWVWDPVIGGPPLGVFTLQEQAIQFASDRIGQLTSGDGALVFGSESDPETDGDGADPGTQEPGTQEPCPECGRHPANCKCEPESYDDGGY